MVNNTPSGAKIQSPSSYRYWVLLDSTLRTNWSWAQ